MSWRKNVMRTFAFAIVSVFAPVAFAGTPAYTVVELGDLGGGQSFAYGLNDLNQVVGASTAAGGETHAFLWDEGTMTDLGTLGGPGSRAWAINNAGTIVGESLPTGQTGSANYRAFTYPAGGSMTALATLGGTWSVAYDINESGVICGLSYSNLQREKAVTWTGGAILDIAVAGGSTKQRSRAYGINDSGSAAGWEYTPLGGPNDAWKYVGGSWAPIGGQGQFQNAEAYDITNSGIVVGSSAPTSGGDWRAAIWFPANPTVPVILGSLPGFPLSELDDMNDDGIAVGRAYVTGSTGRAIIYDGTALHDLNDFLPEDFAGELVDAREINADGAIAATAQFGGSFEAVLLVPVPDAILGDITHNGVVDVDDLLALINAWGPCPEKSACDADLNGN